MLRTQGRRGGFSLLLRLPVFSGKSAAGAEARLYREEEAFRGGPPLRLLTKPGGVSQDFLPNTRSKVEAFCAPPSNGLRDF
jgi:hypothetical protein